MRILYLVTSLGIGGAERQALAIAQRMAARGHRVAVLVLRAKLRDEWPATVEVIHVDMLKPPGSVLAALLRAARVVRSFHPDLIHSHTFPANMAARILKLFLWRMKVVATVHNVYEGNWARMLAYCLSDPLCIRTTAVSRAAMNRYVRLHAVPARKCAFVANGIETDDFAPSQERRARTRTSFGVGDEFVWLSAGRIVPAKDFANLLHAFVQAREASWNARLWIAGEPSEPEFSRVSSLAIELGIAERIQWLGLRRDFPALLDAADGFVLASSWEGMPLVVGEAMAMEKPLVATDVGGTAELTGDAGCVVPPRAPDALAAAMLDVMEASREQRRNLGRRARRRILTLFSMGAKADEWERLYRAVLRLPGSQPGQEARCAGLR